MNVYIYAADIYCEDCGEAIRNQIICAGLAPDDPDDERSYDSDNFPKGPYPDGGGEADCPQHCGEGDYCLNAIELDSGYKIGAWLENELTTAGVEYVREVIRGGGEVAEMWAEFYDEAAHIPPTLPNGRPIKYLVECWECQHGSPAAWGNDPCRQCPHQQ